MKQTIKFINETEAQVTKAFMKKAVIFGTPEYKLWREYKKDFPEAQMIVKKIKRNANKKTYKNMTYQNMIRFIKQQPNAEAQLKEFEKQKEMASICKSPYKKVLNWFINEYQEFDDFFVDNYDQNNTEYLNTIA